MFETGIRQFRMAMGMVRGRRLDTGNLARLVDDARKTIAEFGEPGMDVQQIVDGPAGDPGAREHFATQGIRRTAARLAAESPFYARRFAAAGVDPAKLRPGGLGAIPVTTKADLIDRQDEFRCAGTARHLATRTTGTTGRPAEIWLSRYEIELWPALIALSAVLTDELRTSDVMQVNISSRQTAAVHLNAASCRLAGAACRVLGVVPVDEALDALADGGSTLLSASPSYLAELVLGARRRGMGPGDFRLRGIQAGGEVLSPSVAAAVSETFGVERVGDNFGMTEVIPMSARACRQDHLHHDINLGLVEYLDLETSAPAEPGALATLVMTPFFPYRDCMPVFRYDTRDVVRMLPEEPLTCELSAMPATTHLLGKAGHLLRTGSGDLVTPRQLVEAVEGLPTRPWPARFRASVHNGRLRLTLPAGAVDGFGEAAARAHFAEAGLDVALEIVPDGQAISLRHVRSDLHETTFSARPALIGA